MNSLKDTKMKRDYNMKDLRVRVNWMISKMIGSAKNKQMLSRISLHN